MLSEYQISPSGLPARLYHGSVTPNIAELTPRLRYTPGQLGEDASAAIYATNDPAYAAAHAFPWGSDEGFDLRYVDGVLTFGVPKQFRSRLNVPIYIYELPPEAFVLLTDVTPIGKNFWAHVAVRPIGCKTFPTVDQAITQNGGSVQFL